MTNPKHQAIRARLEMFTAMRDEAHQAAREHGEAAAYLRTCATRERWWRFTNRRILTAEGLYEEAKAITALQRAADADRACAVWADRLAELGDRTVHGPETTDADPA